MSIGSEKFNVIRDNGTTITLLAQYNISDDYKQTTTNNYEFFLGNGEWEYTPGPQEIDIQAQGGDATAYVNEYVSYLKELTNDNLLSGDLISLRELEELGCVITSDYSRSNNETCVGSSFESWLINGQQWWTKSAYSTNSDYVWTVKSDGGLINVDAWTFSYAVRPVITVSKAAIEGNLISFTINNVSLNAVDGMTWGDWLDSSYNPDTYILKEKDSFWLNAGTISAGAIPSYGDVSVKTTDVIVAGRTYVANHSGAAP